VDEVQRLRGENEALRRRVADLDAERARLIRLEQEVAARRAELQVIYDHAPFLLAVVDGDRGVTYANRAFLEYAGCPSDCTVTAAACGALGCVRALDDPRGCGFGPRCASCSLRMALQDTLVTGRSHQDVEHATEVVRDGQRREVVWLGATAPLPSDEGPRMLLALQDITDRTHAERALAEEKQKFQALFETMVQGAFIRDCDGAPIVVNQAALDMLGVTREQFMDADRFERRWDVIAEDGTPLGLEARPSILAMEAGVPLRNLVVGLRDRTHRHRRWLAINATPQYRPGDERPFQVFVTLHDITARKEAEDAVLASEARLRALSARLETSREEERSRLSREIHDQLGQMVTGLILGLRRLERSLDAPGRDVRANELLDQAVAASELAEATLTTVRTIAHELRPGLLDHLGLMAALEHEAGEFEAQTSIPCRLHVAPDLPAPGEAMSTAVFRVFQEALTNVKRHARARSVSVTFGRDDEGWVLEVQDDGVGVTPGTLDEPESLGVLGMRERARALGGRIAFERASPRGGTILTLRVPEAGAGRGA